VIKEKVWKDLELTLKGSQWETWPNLTAEVLSAVCWVPKDKCRASNEFSGPLWDMEYQWEFKTTKGLRTSWILSSHLVQGPYTEARI
jgi:hypothetical protein